ncbi:hypothetical protein ASD65_16340 [Microbacterium sp. Root61]|uniref:hypothetical protein n=1 Tax=Microbacterium sp. Root61 TaxID=1736570 RepID=UPI0006FBCD54|nr:hypothetical protein [Microbacterium sp. Root61]KRA22094.1 hypothetical protein ASD65_16340 [Microbacterium sp. Root61]
MNAQSASSSMVLERRVTWVAPESDAVAPVVPAARRARAFAKLRRWFTRTFDFRDAFTPTSAW